MDMNVQVKINWINIYKNMEVLNSKFITLIKLLIHINQQIIIGKYS